MDDVYLHAKIFPSIQQFYSDFFIFAFCILLLLLKKIKNIRALFKHLRIYIWTGQFRIFAWLHIKMIFFSKENFKCKFILFKCLNWNASVSTPSDQHGYGLKYLIWGRLRARALERGKQRLIKNCGKPSGQRSLIFWLINLEIFRMFCKRSVSTRRRFDVVTTKCKY